MKVSQAPAIGTDFASNAQCAEEVTSDVVNQVLVDGGHKLYRTYIKRKSFPFAVDTAVETSISTVEMHYVAHEEMDDACDWESEEEPSTITADSWCRMLLPRKDKKAAAEPKRIEKRPTTVHGMMRHELSKRLSEGSRTPSEADSAVVRPRSTTISHVPTSNHANPVLHRSSTSPRETTSATIRARLLRANAKTLTGSSSIGRCTPIVYPRDDIPDWEDRARASLARRMQKLRDDKLKEQEDALAAAAADHEAKEEEFPPFTHDSFGNVIWVKEPQSEDLPPLQAMFDFEVPQQSSSCNSKTGVAMQQLVAAPKAMLAKSVASLERSSSSTNIPGAKTKKERPPPEVFTDFCQRHESFQPPLNETMKCQAGVMLQCRDSTGGLVTKRGPKHTRIGGVTTITRKQYLQLTADGGLADQIPAIALDCSLGSGKAVAAASGDNTKDACSQEVEAAKLTSDAAGSATRTGQDQTEENGAAAQSDKRKVVKRMTVQQRPISAPPGGFKAPPAPECGMRNAALVDSRRVLTTQGLSWRPVIIRDKADAIGNPARLPRDRGPGSLGLPVQPVSEAALPAQPPIGATMGHGLVRDVPLEEAYYFPPSHLRRGHVWEQNVERGRLRRAASAGAVRASRG